MEENNSSMSKKKFFLFPALLLALTSLSLTSCGETTTSSDISSSSETSSESSSESSSSTSSETDIVATAITIDNKDDFKDLKTTTDNIMLSVSTTPVGASWTATSSNTDVATILGKWVHFVGGGSSTITVTSGNVSDSVNIVVEDDSALVMTCAEVRLNQTGTTTTFVQVTGKIIGTTSGSFAISDATGGCLVFKALPSGYAIGDVVTVRGNLGAYRNNGQILSTNFAIEHSTETIVPLLSEPTALTAAAYDALPIGYNNFPMMYVTFDASFAVIDGFNDYKVDGSTKPGQFASGIENSRWGFGPEKDGAPATATGLFVDTGSGSYGPSLLVTSWVWKTFEDVTSISITTKPTSLGIGSSSQLETTVNAGARNGATYALVDPADSAIATVTADGLITGVSTGTVEVIATSKYPPTATPVVSEPISIEIVAAPEIVTKTVDELTSDVNGVLVKLEDVKIKEITDTTYGSMIVTDPTDETKTLTLYGLTKTSSSLTYVDGAWKYKNDKSYASLIAASPLKVGDQITIGGIYSSQYSNFSAYFISKLIPPTLFDVTIAEGIEHGSLTPDVTSAIIDTDIHITIAADEGYMLDTITVNGGANLVSSVVDGVLTTKMVDGGIIVTATFVTIESKAYTPISALAVGNGIKVLGKVVAIGFGSLYVSDGTGTAWVYKSGVHSLFAIGDIVEVNGNVVAYGGTIEYSSPTITKVVANKTFADIAPIALTSSNFDEYYTDPVAPTPVTVTDAVVSAFSGNYYILQVQGAEKYIRLNSVVYTYLDGAKVGDFVSLTGYMYSFGTTTVSGTSYSYVFICPTVDPTWTANTNSYPVAVATGIDHGTVALNITEGQIGTEVIVTVTPDSDYELATLTNNGTSFIANKNLDGTYFTTILFGGSTIDATFVLKQVDESPKTSLDVTKLGLESSKYTDSTTDVSIDGVTWGWKQLGNYGSGIQWRTNAAGDSNLYNTSALTGTIQKIVFTWYETANAPADKTDILQIKFGTSTAVDAETLNLSTAAGVKSYTITPTANTHTFVNFLHTKVSGALYFASIEIFMNA